MLYQGWAPEVGDTDNRDTIKDFIGEATVVETWYPPFGLQDSIMRWLNYGRWEAAKVHDWPC